MTTLHEALRARMRSQDAATNQALVSDLFFNNELVAKAYAESLVDDGVDVIGMEAKLEQNFGDLAPHIVADFLAHI